MWTKNPEDAPNTPEYISLYIKNGYIVSINNKKYNSIKCLKTLNYL